MLASLIRSRRAVVVTYMATLLLGMPIIEAAVTRGDFHRFKSLFGASLSAFVVALIGAALAYGANRTRLGRWLLVTAVLALVHLVPALYASRLVVRMDLARAQAFCDSLVPRLEAERRLFGHYPAALSIEPDEFRAAPYWFRRENPARLSCYRPAADRGAFTFEFGDPGDAGRGYVYDSQTHRWKQYFSSNMYF